VNYCQYPNGKMDGRDVLCGGDAVQEVEGYLLCSLHAPMAERGCLSLNSVCVWTAAMRHPEKIETIFRP
jgi:hypothetical protein